MNKTGKSEVGEVEEGGKEEVKEGETEEQDLLEQSRSGSLKVPKEELEGHLHVTDARSDEVVEDIEGLVRST